MEEELHQRPLCRRFVGLESAARMPSKSNILQFRDLLEKHELAARSKQRVQTRRKSSADGRCLDSALASSKDHLDADAVSSSVVPIERDGRFVGANVDVRAPTC